MAKRSYIGSDSEQAITTEEAGESPPQTVRLVCVIGAAKYIAVGKDGNKRYEFIGSEPLEIDMEDAEYLLSKRRGCCGSTPQPLFVKV